MNFRRGLFRIWLIFSLLFACTVFLIQFDDIYSEFVSSAQTKQWKERADVDLLLPIVRKDARGAEGSDYNCDVTTNGNVFQAAPCKNGAQACGPWERDWNKQLPPKGFVIDKVSNVFNQFDTCWYDVKIFRKLYPEYNDLSNDDLSAKLYEKIGQPLKVFHPWRRLRMAALVALGIPFAFLLFGSALFWALLGFKDDSGPKGKDQKIT